MGQLGSLMAYHKFTFPSSKYGFSFVVSIV